MNIIDKLNKINLDITGKKNELYDKRKFIN